MTEKSETKREPTEREVRRGEFTLTSTVGVLLALAIVCMVNYLAFRHYTRWDFTSDERFTLSDQTREVLQGLDRDVEIYFFLSEGESMFDDVRELSTRYRSHSARVSVRHIDPDRDRSEFQLLAERFDIGAAGSGAIQADVAAVVTAGEDRWKITRDDFISYSVEGQGAKVDVKAERALTGALVQVLHGRPAVLCATEGHGEWDLTSGGERSLYFIRGELERNNIELKSIETRGARSLGEGCDAILVAGPVRPFTEGEATALSAFLRRGGNLLLLLDPIPEGTEVAPTGLEDLARDVGIQIDRTFVLELDPQLMLMGNPMEAYLASNFGDHPTTEEIRATGGAAAFHIVRSVRAEEGSDAVALVSTSETSYAEDDLASISPDAELTPSADDIRGPVSVAAAARHPEFVAANQDPDDETVQATRGGRIVVVGDSDFLERTFLSQQQFANYDIFNGWVGWVTEREALISIAPREGDAQAVVMTAGDVAGVGFRVLVLMPLSILLLGFAVWWSRRS